MGNYKFAFLQLVDGLRCLWCNKLFTRPVTLRCGHSLCWACAARVRDREKKPRCRYEDCGVKIRDIKYVVNWALDKVAERAKILKNISKDELAGDIEVEGRSVASSCSMSSMTPPPYMSPGGTSESELFYSNTPEVSGGGDERVEMDTQYDTTINLHQPSDKGPTQVQGSVPFPIRFSDVCSAGDNRFKETQFGGSTTGSYSNQNRFESPNMSRPGSVGLTSVSSMASSDVYSGAEALERTSPGRTSTGPGSLTGSVPHSANSYLQSVKRKPCSVSAAAVKVVLNDLCWQNVHRLTQYPIHSWISDIKSKDSDKPRVTKWGPKSKARKQAKKLLASSEATELTVWSPSQSSVFSKKSTLPAAEVCTSSKKNKVKKTLSRIAAALKPGKSSHRQKSQELCFKNPSCFSDPEQLVHFQNS